MAPVAPSFCKVVHHPAAMAVLSVLALALEQLVMVVCCRCERVQRQDLHVVAECHFPVVLGVVPLILVVVLAVHAVVAA